MKFSSCADVNTQGRELDEEAKEQFYIHDKHLLYFLSIVSSLDNNKDIIAIYPLCHSCT